MLYVALETLLSFVKADPIFVCVDRQEVGYY